MSATFELLLKLQDMVSGPVGRMINMLDGLGTGVTRTNRTFSSFGNTMSSTFNKMLEGALAINILDRTFDTLSDGFNKLMAPSMSFDAQMSELKAVAEPTSQEFDTLRNKALQLGRDTKFSATEASMGLTELAKAGFTASDATKAIDSVLSLAAASGMELGRSSEIVANNMAAFTLPAEQASRVSDVFAKTVNLSTVGMEDMAEAMKYIAPTANALGMSIEETSGIIGILGDYGMKGSIATRALGTSLQRFSKPTDQMLDKMKELGFSVFDSTGTFKGMSSVIEELSAKTANFTQEQKMSAVATLFGSEASGEILTLLNAQKKLQISALNEEQQERLKTLVGVEAYNQALSGSGEIILKGADALKGYTAVLEGAGGAADKMAKTMIDNLKGDVTILSSSWEGLLIRMGDSSGGFMRNLVQSITDIVNSISSNFALIDSIFSSLGNALSPIFDAISNGFGSLGGSGNTTKLIMEGLAGIIKNVVAPSISFLSTLLSPLVEGLAMMARWVADNSSWLSVLAGIYGTVIALQWAWNLALTANPIGLIIAALATLIGLLKMAYDNSETVRIVFDAIGMAGKVAFEAIASAIDWVWDKIMGFVNTLKEVYGAIQDIIGTSEKVENATGIANSVLSASQNSTGSGGDVDLSFLTNKASTVFDGAKSLFNMATDENSTIGKSVSFVKDMFSPTKVPALNIPTSASSLGSSLSSSRLTPNDSVKKGIDTISAGGNKQLHVTVNISKVQASERIEVSGADTSNKGIDDLETKIVTTLTRAINGSIQLQTSY
ncbi:hypothetical protein AD998_02010 [bacterium 336/3]|nr:hypothetical protein AD998_02010 [bacterium 336/3]